MSKIIVITKTITLTEGLNSYLNQKLNKLEKYLHEDTKIYVKLEVKSDGRHKVEVTIPIDMQTIRAEVSDTDMYAAIDRVEATLTRNLRKHKEKMIQRHRKTSHTTVEPLVEKNGFYQIARSKKHELCSMTEQEACEEMEMTSHSFYVYCDCNRNDAVCTVYVREDGTYGLLIFE